MSSLAFSALWFSPGVSEESGLSVNAVSSVALFSCSWLPSDDSDCFLASSPTWDVSLSAFPSAPGARRLCLWSLVEELPSAEFSDPAEALGRGWGDLAFFPVLLSAGVSSEVPSLTFFPPAVEEAWEEILAEPTVFFGVADLAVRKWHWVRTKLFSETKEALCKKSAYNSDDERNERKK